MRIVISEGPAKGVEGSVIEVLEPFGQTSYVVVTDGGGRIVIDSDLVEAL